MSLLAPPLRVDWSAVILDLVRLGFSRVEIAAETGVPRTHLDEYEDGRDMKHAVGERMIAYWCAQTGRTRDQLPMRRAIWSAAAAKRLAC